MSLTCPRCGREMTAYVSYPITQSPGERRIFAAMAQLEREMMLEQQREGIAKAKAEGKYKSRKPTARLNAEDAVRLYRGKRFAHIAKELGIGRGSVYRALEAAGLSAS